MNLQNRWNKNYCIILLLMKRRIFLQGLPHKKTALFKEQFFLYIKTELIKHISYSELHLPA